MMSHTRTWAENERMESEADPLFEPDEGIV